LMIIFVFINSNGSKVENGSDVWEPYSEEINGSNVFIDMVPVQGGIYQMGPDLHDVKVDSFWMSKHEITWEQYDLFAKEVISDLEHQIKSQTENLGISVDAISIPTPPYVDMSFGMGRENRPAISMTHYAAVMFTKWLSAKTGRFYRLPTEAEWEYACRAGSDSEYHHDQPSELNDYDWFASNSNGSYNPVGTKEPNAFGLYDMQGNVAEWTMDQYVEDYHDQLERDIAVNPWFKPQTLYPRSVRGGSWMDEAGDAHCARRRGSQERWKILDPQLPKSLWWHTNARFLGFRIVRPKVTPSPDEMEKYWIEAMEDF